MGASLVAQRLKCLPAMRETWVRSLGREDPLEKQMATHSSVLAWRIPWTEEPGGLQSTRLQRVGHDWATSLSYTFFLSLFYGCSWLLSWVKPGTLIWWPSLKLTQDLRHDHSCAPHFTTVLSFLGLFPYKVLVFIFTGEFSLHEAMSRNNPLFGGQWVFFFSCRLFKEIAFIPEYWLCVGLTSRSMPWTALDLKAVALYQIR